MVIDKNKKVAGYKLWDYGYGPLEALIPVCRELASESAVLLKNKNNVLPLDTKEKIAVFGRMQLDYYKSGNGSGGNVRAKYVPSIIDAIKKETDLVVDNDILNVYKNWVADHPFDNGNGWATEPWSQAEMELDHEIVKEAAKRNDAAVIVIGRTSGEDKDNINEKGSFLFDDVEIDMIEKVCSVFDKVVVLLNAGNIFDISVLEAYNISSLMYVWQGGMEGANAIADLLTGKVSPSGKLVDTQAYHYEDYPSSKNFGGDSENIYEEDIYVGYRYFETFAKEKVLYPFGFGMSYTSFDIAYRTELSNDVLNIFAKVKNIGRFAGKEVVQIYYSAPQGTLGNPVRQLIAFKKTKTLFPGECEELKISFKVTDMASYDDSGVSGNAFCYVMEKGDFVIFAGTDVRSCAPIYTYVNEATVVTEELKQVMAPTKRFKRWCAALNEDNEIVKILKDAPQITYNIDDRSAQNRPETIKYTGDRGIKLVDVAEGKNDLEEFVAQFSISDLCQMVCGEGMCSPKVKRQGTGGAMGGVTDSLSAFGLPVVCLTDGPAGLRFVGEATSIPIATALACTWNPQSVEQMAELLGIEVFANDIDVLLGCGLNIHRNPLCGRNFEYFSEDPLISGRFASAFTRGISKSGASITIKHFAVNSQEKNRHNCDSVVSERALREIYLKGFEIAVKEGDATAVMTSYNSINGTWAASNYDLTTSILREEWGFKGFVMTDWWANCNWNLSAPSKENLQSMVRSQNDIYMVCPDAKTKQHDIIEGIENGFITLGELQRNVINILRHIMTTPSFLKFIDEGCQSTVFEQSDVNMRSFCTFKDIKPGEEYQIEIVSNNTKICLELHVSCSADSLAQIPIRVYANGNRLLTLIVNGTDGNVIVDKRFLTLNEGHHALAFECSDCVQIKKIDIKK